MNEDSQAPVCVGIILDGNRRWAKERGLPTFDGHRAGMEKVKEATRFVRASGVAHLIVYAFSTENWNRDTSEVSYLMGIFREVMQKQMQELSKEGVKVRFVGQRDRFSKDLQELMGATEEQSRENDTFTLWVCLSYGGRAEIAAAARAAAVAGEDITEESLARHLWTVGMPDPDIIIRTSGEQRLSGFLTWQSVYSELFFTDTKWPAFSEEEYKAILAEYLQRERRRGK